MMLQVMGFNQILPLSLQQKLLIVKDGMVILLFRTGTHLMFNLHNNVLMVKNIKDMGVLKQQHLSTGVKILEQLLHC